MFKFLRNCRCFPKCLCYFKISLNTGDLSSIPGWGRSPGRGNGYPLQYSCLENSVDRGDWQATVTKSQTRLSNFHFHFHQGRRVHPSLMPWQHFDIVLFLNHSSGGEVVSHCMCVYLIWLSQVSCGMWHEGLSLGPLPMVGVKGLNHWIAREVPQCVFDLHFSDD